jgi:Asp-tRNA(Asn)/Glu-tRNA(Gln) amidotransferase A subunit family amidase
MLHGSPHKLILGAVLAVALCTLPPIAEGQDYTNLSATDAARLIRDGRITSHDLVEALLKQIDAGQDLHAFITVDREGALKAAGEADRVRQTGAQLPPLHGVPIVLKDNIHVAGLPNTAGTPALRNFVPTENAPVAEALIEAGAIVLGKNNMHELAFGITSDNAAFGSVRTPYDTSRFAGGSSGGTGAAIAARMALAGLGSDTGGSVRIPAALNGISGLRPTVGRYSGEGITPIAHTRDTAGPMARTIGDLVLLDQVITGDKSSDVPARLSAMRLGVARTPFYSNLDPEVAEVMEVALTKLRAAGVQLVEVEMAGVTEANNNVSFPVALYEGNVDLAAYLAKYHTGLTVRDVAAQIASPGVKFVFDTFIVGEKAIPEAVYRDAIEQQRPKLQKLYADTFVKYRLDALVFPTTPLPALTMDSVNELSLNGKTLPTFFTFISNTDPGSNAGIPGLSLPMGMTANGLPLGMALDGPAGSDRRLLAIGLALESTLGPVPAPKR